MNEENFLEMTTNEAMEILAASFERHGLKLNIAGLISDNRKIQDGRKVLKTSRRAPILKHIKRGKNYFYTAHDLQTYIDEMVDYHDQKLQLPYRRVTSLTIQECLDELGEVYEIKLKNGFKLNIGWASENEQRVAVTTTDNKLYYLDVEQEEGGENV